MKNDFKVMIESTHSFACDWLDVIKSLFDFGTNIF